MKEKKSLGLKIPAEIHSALKILATQKSIGLIEFAENIMIEASKSQDLLEKAIKKTLEN